MKIRDTQTETSSEASTSALTLTRRQLLGGLGVAFVASQLPGCSSEGDDFAEPEVLRSRDKRLEVSLDVRMATVTVGPMTFQTRTYNGRIPGPTLELRPGDTLRVKLDNKLDPATDLPAEGSHGSNVPNRFSTTNLHTHGLHVPVAETPEGVGDDVLLEVPPGSLKQYFFPIPENHPEGTYWYHAHRHGSTAIQVMGGLAGALIIRGPTDEVPEIKAATERIFVIQELQLNQSGDKYSLPPFDQLHGTSTHDHRTARMAVNGVMAPTVHIKPGEVQRWRLIHAGFHDQLPITLKDHSFVIIAIDGITLSAPREVTTFNMLPGNRYDVLVKGGAPGTYTLRAEGYEQDDQSPHIMPFVEGKDIASLVVLDEPPVDMRLPTALPQQRLYTPVTNAEIDGIPVRKLTFGFTSAGPTIDGSSFQHGVVSQTLKLGTAQEWLVENTSLGDHPFHIHVDSFMVTELDGVPVPENERTWQDVALVPRKKADGTPGRLRFRMRYLDFTGKFVLHCHMLEHEDQGMMQVVEVVA